jgi:chorismate mutase
VGETASASVSLADYRKNEKLAAFEQRVRELQTLLLCASRERLRLMNQIAEVREKLGEAQRLSSKVTSCTRLHLAGSPTSPANEQTTWVSRMPALNGITLKK